MLVRTLRTWSLAATLTLALACSAFAQLEFQYATDAEPNQADGDQGGFVRLIEGLTFRTATCDDSLTPPGTDIVLANLEIVSEAAADNPENVNTDYQILVTLMDPITSATQDLLITGNLSGSFSSSTANVNNTFGALPGSVTLGDVTYSITELVYAPPEAPGGLLGAITAHVVCLEDQAPPVPEPGTWAMLIGAAVPGLGLIRRMRR